MDNNLQQLADKLGISTQFADAGMIRQEYQVCDDVIRFFAERMGYKAGNNEEVEASLAAFDRRRWQQSLEKIYVVEQNNVNFDLVIPAESENENFELFLTREGSEKAEAVSFNVVNNEEYRLIGKTKYVRLQFIITSPLEIGYYNVDLRVANKRYKTQLAVAPERCYANPALDGKIWGYAIQLYSVRSERNWGVGDFTDLCNIVRMSARAGAGIIGLNPLNVLAHDYPENASPYQSVSRLFLNPIYIDIEAVPEFLPEDRTEIAGEVNELRQSELIQYEHIYPLKVRMLEKFYERFKTSTDKKRKDEYEAFVKEQGSDLEKLAIFQTLYNEKTTSIWGGWKAWPEEYRNPHSLAVRDYAKEHADKIGFFKFMQFEAFRQFDKAQKLVDELGLKIGFYRDLAVGVGQDSAEVWSEPDLFFKDAGAGAPPDAFFPCGQKWGLGAFRPTALKEDAYRPFIRILRANMKNSGALRIDHVMSLMRLYIIPEKADLGTYIYYNFQDMLNIVALESCLNKCAIVGESIGNVPDGFLSILEQKNIYSLSVLWAERYNAGWGDFISPSEYPARAFVSVGTHDMAPLRMWWFGFDIEQSYQLGLISSEQERNQAYKKRETDRWKLLGALDNSHVWPEDNQRKNNYIYGERYPEGIEEAVNRYMAQTPCAVFLAQLEDILHVEKMQNLPGTDRDLHPNWRRKLPVKLEVLENDIAYVRNLKAIHQER